MKRFPRLVCTGREVYGRHKQTILILCGMSDDTSDTVRELGSGDGLAE